MCFHKCFFVLAAFLNCVDGIADRFGIPEFPINLLCYDVTLPIPPITIDTTFSRHEERELLHQFYQETRGTNWTLQYGWSSFNTTGLTTYIDHCNWTGVMCKQGYVTALTLNRNNLSGRVPSLLWKFRNLMIICLRNNNLYGKLEEFVFPNMTNLLQLDFAFCYLSGSISDNLFANLTSLMKIQLCCQKSSSKLWGLIPQSIVNLKHLRVLSLGENRFSGPIPHQIGKLEDLWFLDLEYMPSLSGRINWFLGLKSLTKMHLTSAGISGEMPDDFGSFFPHLKEMQLRQNTINGSFPTSIDKMINLTKIVLCSNLLHGKLPKQLGNLPHLRILDLSNNNFSEFDNDLSLKESPKLEIFLLGNNKKLFARLEHFITSLVPVDAHGHPSLLRVLNISSCNFHGYMDGVIWGLSNLIVLDIRDNKVGGSIPEVINDLMFLTHLDFANNQFEGALPNTFRLLQSLNVLDLRGNRRMAAPESKINITSGTIQEILKIKPYFRQKNLNYSCPFATLTSTNGTVFMDPSYYYHKFCVCGEGFFGGFGKCIKCMDKGDCSGDVNDNEQILMKIERGYWPSPSINNNVTHLVKCPGLPGDKDWACNPSGMCKCWLNISNFDQTVCDKTCLCHDGNTGIYCSQCQTNYYKSGSLCKKCPSDSSSIYYIIPITIICLLAMWGALYFCHRKTSVRFVVLVMQIIFLLVMRLFEIIPGWFLEVSVVVMLFYIAGVTQDTTGIISILVFYIQVLDAMILGHNIQYPKFVLTFQNYMNNVMNLDFTGVSCKLPLLFTPLGNYLLVVLFPIGCLFLIWLYYGGSILISYASRNRENNSINTTRYSCQKLSIMCLSFTFFPVAKNTIALLAPCRYDENYVYMQIAPWIQCSDSDPTYTTLILLGWLAIIFYVITLPITLLGLLVWYNRNKHKFSDENKKVCDSWLGSIYLPYKDDVQWYFEIFKIARKFLIALFLAVLPRTSSIQTLTVCIVLMLALMYQIKFEPYKVHNDARVSFENTLEVITLVVLQQSFVMLRFASYDVNASSGIVSTVIAYNIFVLISFLVAIPSILINSCSNSTNSNNENANANERTTDERTHLLQGNRTEA